MGCLKGRWTPFPGSTLASESPAPFEPCTKLLLPLEWGLLPLRGSPRHLGPSIPFSQVCPGTLASSALLHLHWECLPPFPNGLFKSTHVQSLPLPFSLPGLAGNALPSLIFPEPFSHVHFFFFSFLVFLGLHSQHVEVPRLGVASKLPLLPFATAIATRDPSRTCDLHHSSRQRRILNPRIKARDGTCVLMDTSQVHDH